MLDPRIRAFIEKCIANVSDRLSAEELLMDPFLRSDEESECLGKSLQSKTHDTGKDEMFLRASLLLLFHDSPNLV